MRVLLLLFATFAAAVLAVGYWLLSDRGDDPPLFTEKNISRDLPGAPPLGVDGERRGENRPREAMVTRAESLSREILEEPCISGTVTDRLTGRPVAMYGGIELWEKDREGRWMREVDLERYHVAKDGAFAVPLSDLTLHEGRRYCLVFDYHGYVIRAYEDLITAARKPRTGLDVKLEPEGCLELVCKSFSKTDLSDLILRLECRTRQEEEVFWIYRHRYSFWIPAHLQNSLTEGCGGFGREGSFEPDGSRITRWDLVPGLWTLTVAMGRTTNFTFHRDEIIPPFEVAGSMLYSNGSPVVGAELIFSALEVPSFNSGTSPLYEPNFRKKRRLNSRCVTDGSGAFKPLDLLPGTWRLTTYLKNGAAPFFPDIVIPSDPKSPFPIDLVVHQGTVSGTLCDSATRIPFGDDYTRWFLLVRDCSTGEVVAERSDHFGSDFTIGCVPPGRHRLEVRARDFVSFASGAFGLAAGQDLRLGALGIARQERYGTLLLAIVDGSHQPIAKRVNIAVAKPLGLQGRFDILPEGDKGYGLERLGGHRYRLDRLPAERLTFRIGRSGKVLRDLELTIEPGRDLEETLIVDDL